MKHTSPAKSPAHLRLRRSAVRAGFRDDDIRVFLWLINAHDQLVAFVQICENLSRILDLLQSCLQVSLDDYDMSSWPEITRWVVASQPSLEAEIGPQFNSAPDGAHPVLGKGATRHGVYASLWNKHENPEKYEYFWLVMGHLLLAHVKWTSEKIPLARYEEHGSQGEIGGFPNSPYGAALSIRVLSTREAEPALERLNPYMAPKSFAQLMGMRDYSDDELGAGQEHLVNHLRSFSNFVAKIYGEKPWVTRSGGGGGQGRRWQPGFVDVTTSQEYVPVDLGDIDDPYHDWGGQELIREITETGAPLDIKRIKDLLKLDVHPAELAGADELYLADYQCSDAKKGLAGLILAARGQVRHVTMQNQMLPWQYRQLSMTEIARLLKELSSMMRALKIKAIWEDDDQLLAESVALVHVALWTGSTLERAKGLQVFSGKQPPDCELSLYLPDEGEHILRPEERTVEWRVRSYYPQYKMRIKAPDKIVRARTRYIYLPDIAGGADFLRQLRHRVRRRAPKSMPFRRALSRYKSKIRDLFRRLDGTGRITERKIESFLFHRIAAIHGDVTDAVAITGQGHPLAQVRAFYATPSINHLRSVYVTAVEHVRQSINGSSVTPDPARSAVPNVEDLHVGSRLCARQEAVHDAVARLQETIKEAAAYSTSEAFVRYHNLYTLYTVLMFGYSTACRAIVTPFLSSDRIDPESQLSSLADKDGPDQHKSRLIWVTPGLAQQIRHYEAHCNVLLASFGETLKRPDRISATPPCFFIEEKNGKHRLTEVRPGTLEPRLREFLALPANSHRRFLRTELRERGCSIETIDAFMGHWARGEEPWGKFSSFSYSHYVQELQDTLLPLLNDLGWRAIASSLGKG